MKNSLKDLKFWIGIVLSAFFLWLSLRNVHWPDVWQAFSDIDYIYLIPSALLILLADYIRAIRWQYLLLEIKKIKVYQLFSIIMISQFLLQVLPARIGEIIRAYLVGKKYSISKTASFSSIVVERIFDGTFVMIVFAISLYAYPGNLEMSIPGAPDFSLKRIIIVFTAIYVLALCVLLLLKCFPIVSAKVVGCLLHFFPTVVKNKAMNLLNDFISGLTIFHNIRNLLISMATTVVIWLLATCSYYVALMAFNIQAPFYFSFILLGFIIIAVMIPAAPGFVGVFHFVVQVTLQKFFNTPPAVALSFAWAIWFSGMFISVVPGLYYFNQYHLHMKNLKEEEAQLDFNKVPETGVPD